MGTIGDRGRLVKNTLSMFVTQFGSYALPLITIPYLTRVLHPEAFGLVAFMQSVALYVALIVDFGFVYSGTRTIAQARDEPQRLSRLASEISLAKGILIATTLLVCVVLQFIVPTMRQNPLAFWLGVISGVAQGLNTIWFFRGIERLSLMITIDFLCKLAASASVFVVVHKPADAVRVLGAQAFFFTLGAVLLHARIHQEVGFAAPDVRTSFGSLRESFTLFLLRSAGGLFSSANSLILGLFAGPLAVGYYSGPDKIVKAAYGLQDPVSSSIYPRLSYLSVHDKKAARRLAIWGAVLQIGMMVPICAVLYFGAPWLVRTFLGPGYGPSITVLRILLFLLLPSATASVLGLQWMVSQGMESFLTWTTVAAGVINVVLAYVLVGNYRQNGMATSVVIAETFVAVTLIVYLTVRALQGKPTGQATASDGTVTTGRAAAPQLHGPNSMD